MITVVGCVHKGRAGFEPGWLQTLRITQALTSGDSPEVTAGPSLGRLSRESCHSKENHALVKRPDWIADGVAVGLSLVKILYTRESKTLHSLHQSCSSSASGASSWK